MQCFCVCVRCESIPIHEPCESCFVAWLFSRSHSSDLFPFLFRSLFSPFLVFSLAKWSEAWRQFYAFHSLLFPIALSRYTVPFYFYLAHCYSELYEHDSNIAMYFNDSFIVLSHCVCFIVFANPCERREAHISLSLSPSHSVSH